MTRQELFEWIWREPAKKVAEQMGVPPVVLRRYCRKMNIPTPSTGYWSKLKFGKSVEIPALPEFTEELPSVEKGLGKGKDDVFLDPRQRIQYELQQLDPTIFVVPEILYAKDPLVIDTKEYYRGKKNAKYLNKNPFKSEIEGPLGIQVEMENLDRALRVFATVIQVLKIRGHQIVSSNSWYSYACVDGEAIQVRIAEVYKRDANAEWSYPRTKPIPTGKLRFEITRIKDSHKHLVLIEDASTVKLEDKILNIVAKIEYEAIYIKEEEARQERLRLEREEAHRQWEIEEKRRKELEDRQEKEVERLKEVFLSAELYAWASVLRAYAERYEAYLNGKEIRDAGELEKLQWLKNKVEWIDPFIDHDDELLTNDHKKELFWPETHGFSYLNPYRSHASWPEFNFWNNPFRRSR